MCPDMSHNRSEQYFIDHQDCDNALDRQNYDKTEFHVNGAKI